MPEVSLDSTSALNQAQQALARRLLAGPLPIGVLLLAPVGAGKTFLARTVARRLFENDSQTQALFIVPHRVMASAYEEALPARHLHLFSRAALRDVQDSSVVPFAAPVAVFVTGEALKAREMQGALSEIPWDLVVVDEAQTLGDATGAMVRRLVDKRGFDRLLLLAQGDSDENVEHYWGDLPVDIARWRLPLLERVPPTDARTASVQVVTFHRSGEERRIIAEAERLSAGLDAWLESALGARVRSASESSFYALEQELLVLIDALQRRRNTLAHKRTSGHEPAAAEQAQQLPALVDALTVLLQLADDADALSTDSKTQIFQELIERLQEDPQSGPVVVFVRVAATAAYLHSVLAHAGRPALVATGEEWTPTDAVQQVVANRGVLLVVDEALPAYDLRAFDTGVHYDLPAADAHGWRDRFARLGWLDNPDEVTTYALVDAERAAEFGWVEEGSEGSTGTPKSGRP